MKSARFHMSSSADATSNAPLLGDDDAPARPSLLGTQALSTQQGRLDERIRTLSLVICAIGVLSAAVYYLQNILVRFVLALALRYLLTPLIDLINVELRFCGRCRCRLPRWLCILLALSIVAGGLLGVGIVVARSVASFSDHAAMYKQRVEDVLGSAMEATSKFQALIPSVTTGLSLQDMDKARLLQLAKSADVSGIILNFLGTFAHLTENSIYILLILAFLLAGSKPPPPGKAGDPSVHTRAESQIFAYIRGKIAISLLVALVDAAFLWFVGLDLWLVFGVLAFLLNFIPNVGMATSVVLPMPLVLLDPRFGPGAILLAFLGPLLAGLAAKDVLEPLLIGRSTSLQPVAVLLAIMLWGSVWGVTGMVLAVPMTAVLRIYLESVDHPLSRYIASVLAGTSDERAAVVGAATAAEAHNEAHEELHGEGGIEAPGASSSPPGVLQLAQLR